MYASTPPGPVDPSSNIINVFEVAVWEAVAAVAVAAKISFIGIYLVYRYENS